MRELQPGEVFAGHRIEGVAGQGGMGVVYRATDLRLKRVVALKLIAARFAQDDEFRRRFERESELAASIRHPNVITVYSAGEHEGSLFITMELIEGTDMREMIATYGALDPAFVAKMISQVAGALDAAHNRGLIHRDVKPANILLGQENGEYQAYLTDFGLTKRNADARGGESGLTQAGTFVGTLDYIAPEQLKGDPVDARTDVYSLGCVFYQALTGQVPYPRPSEPAKMWAHVGEPPPTLQVSAPHLAPQFEAVVQKGMAKEPDDRYQTAGELGRDALAAAGVGGQVPATDSGATQRQTQPPVPPPKSNRTKILAIAGGVLALAIIGVVLALTLGGGGGGGGTETVTQAKTGPTPDFENKVEAICRDRKAQINAYATQISDVQDDKDKTAELLGQLHDAVLGLRDQLQALTPPDDQAQGYSQYISDLQELADAVTETQNAIKSGDASAAQTAGQKVQDVGTRADENGKNVPALVPCST